MTDTAMPHVPPHLAGRFAEIRAQINARDAAESADPALFWRRMGSQAARDAVLAERLVPVEGVAAFREAFDEALPQARAANPLGRPAAT